MDSSKTYFIKLPIQNDCNSEQNPLILIQSQWSDSKIVFSLQEPKMNTGFQGEITIDELKESATELEIPYEEFYNDCYKALTTNLGVESFIYELDRDQKKLLLNKKSTYTILYLDIQLQETNKIANEMLEAAVNIINQQSIHSKETDGINEKLQQSYQETISAFEKCIEEKNNLENKLLKKFALLLNAKKDKIAELQEILLEKGSNFDDNDKYQERNGSDDANMELSTRPSTSSVATERIISRKNKKIMAIESDEDDDYLQPTQEMTPPRDDINNESN